MIEMMVSIAIFSFIMIGIYFFFDTGRWMYLHSERKANQQENGRLAIEGMEREMRMIGLGIPSGTRITDNLTWNPPIIYGTVNSIGFRGDMDSYNAIVTQDIASGDTQIHVDQPTYVCPQAGTNLLIVDSGRNWQSTTCNSTAAGVINVSPGAQQAFAVADTEIFAPIQVFYRFSPDTDANGICDQDSATIPDYSQCIIERAEERSLDPLAAPSNDNLWQVYATNIQKFQLSYFRKTSAGYQAIGSPLVALSNSVDVIRILITAKDRSAFGKEIVRVANSPQEYQTTDFTTDVLIRKHRY